MDTIEIFEELLRRARSNEGLKKKLLETRKARQPLTAFCAAAAEEGFQLTPMEIVDAGEYSHAAMKRSTNGGGENSPMLDYQDDYYSMLLAALDC